MEPAAWITTKFSLHLSSLTAFSDLVGAEYHLTKKGKTDGA